MAKTILPASVENRLKSQADAWHRLAQRREGEKQSVRIAPFITISRQYGCSAFDLGHALAQRLQRMFPHRDYYVYDRRTLEVLTERDGVSDDMLASLPDGRRETVTTWVNGLEASTTEDAGFRHLATTMCAIAALGGAIIVGRGGAVVTRGVPGGLHVRLIAPQAWRVARLQKTDHEAEATPRFVEHADEERERFLEEHLGADANDPQLYHLTLNNQMLSTQEQAEAITAMVRQRVDAGIVQVT